MNCLCTSTPQAISLFAGHDILAIVMRAEGKVFNRELPFAFNDAFRCSIIQATISDGI